MSAVASILSGVQPDNYLVWDIETGQPPEADIMQQIEGKLLPKISPSECEQLTATEMAKAGISDTKRKQLIEAGDLPEAEKNGRANVWPVKAVNAAIDNLNGQITADAIPADTHNAGNPWNNNPSHHEIEEAESDCQPQKLGCK